MKTKIVLGIVLSLFCLLPTAFAQNYRGAIRGRLTDTNGSAIAGVAVKAVRTDTGETRNATSTASGEYQFSLLPPGAFRLEFNKGGFKHYKVNLVLSVNQDLRSDLAMQIAGLEETVEINQELALNTNSSALGAVLENRQITGLPLDGRNFLELSLLVPGATPAAPGSAGSVRGDFAFTINGAREDANNFLLDGVYNVDPKLNTFGVKPPVDAVREVSS